MGAFSTLRDDLPALPDVNGWELVEVCKEALSRVQAALSVLQAGLARAAQVVPVVGALGLGLACGGWMPAHDGTSGISAWCSRSR